MRVAGGLPGDERLAGTLHGWLQFRSDIAFPPFRGRRYTADSDSECLYFLEFSWGAKHFSTLIRRISTRLLRRHYGVVGLVAEGGIERRMQGSRVRRMDLEVVLQREG